VLYKCSRCEDTGMVAGAPEFAYMSWRQVLAKGTQSPSMKRWAEHMPSAECPECAGKFEALEKPVPPAPPEVKPKRKYTKRAPRWNK